MKVDAESPQSRCHSFLPIEPLEHRVAPAAVFTFTDVDGDLVTIKTSRGTDAELGAILAFSSVDPAAPRSLIQINFGINPDAFLGTNLSIVAKRSPESGGNGFVNVGRIDASSLDGGGLACPLGAITIDGDLGDIDVDATASIPVAVKSLKTQSMGRSAVAVGTSTISGDIGSWMVKSDWTTVNADIAGTLKTFRIGGSLRGGDLGGALINAEEIGSVFVGKDIIGSVGGSARIGAPVIGNVTVGGSIVGGDGGSGAINGFESTGAVKIGGDLLGGYGNNSGRIDSTIGTIESLTIRGSVVGGSGSGTGFIFTGDSIGSVRIGGSLVGSDAGNTGTIRMNSGTSTIKSIFIGGSIVGGRADSSGYIDVAGKIGTLTVLGSVVGASAEDAQIATNSGAIDIGRAAKISIGGALIAGRDDTTGNFINSGSIRANDDIGQLVIKGGVYGNATNPALITARGQLDPSATKNIAIGKLTVAGNVEFARILAGYNTFGTTIDGVGGTNADAQIGSVTVSGDFVASSLAAGIDDLGDGFGNAFDTRILGGNTISISARIASVVIKGQVTGTASLGDHFGIVAEEIVSVTIAGVKLPLQAGVGNDDLDAVSALLLLGANSDVRVHEAVLLP